MDKATTAAVLGTILGLAAGVAGMLAFGPRDDGRNEEHEHRVATLDADLQTQKQEMEGLRKQLADANRKAESAGSFADELDRAAREKAEAQQRAEALKKELDALKGSSAEEQRQNAARIAELERILSENGITEHLSDEVVAERMEKLEATFNTAFGGRDKKGSMEALWQLQALGPRAYDKSIELWRKMAEDYGLNPFGQGPNTLGLQFQDYVSLISSWGLVQTALTDPEMASDFRIAAIYAAPWWASQDPGERARLVGAVLLRSSGYESRAAMDALRDIDSPESVRYLIDYLAQNRDNPAGRKQAIDTLAGKGTPEALAAIEDAAKHDVDETVRAHAHSALEASKVSIAGVRITTVGADSQGALAGIKVGDIMTHYNGVRVKTIAEIIAARDAAPADSSVKVIVRRGNEDLTLTLAPGPIGINGVAVAPKE